MCRCPVDCIPLDPSHQETQTELLDKYQRLQQKEAEVIPA
jgi:hypothetical protein